MAKDNHTFAVNDRVGNPVFGTGTITEVNSRYTTIAFDDGKARKFLTNMVRLEPSDTQAPTRPSRAAKKTGKPPKK